MVEVLKLAAPCVVLLDELVAYARQLPDERFEALLSFVQSLTEAAKMVPGALVVGSLPESASEAGGERGQAALLRLEKVFGRVQSAWLPASGDETYEIVRRRLFQELDADGERAREETVKAFHDLYRRNAAEFPPEAREARYGELLRLSYPIHPELFDRLSKEWAGLDKFQRTRGVLRFLANVVGVLWQAKRGEPLITPARVPVAHERVRAGVLYPLDAGFAAVVDREVDGDGALPARMEAAGPARRASKAQAPTRAARAVFLSSAPLAGRPNAGLTGPALRLACAEPGDQLAIFGESLRELAERATYLYEESGRHWFSTQPTLNRLADERARALPDHEVDGDIAKLLREEAAAKGTGFHRVHAAPDDPTAIDEAPALSLVILGPAAPHAGKGVAESAATKAVTDALLRCRASQRRFRNTLLFVAPDEAQLAVAREAVRRALAWERIVADAQLMDQLKTAQVKDAGEKARAAREGARKAARSAWAHVLFPVKAEVPGKAFDLDHISLAARDRAALPAAAYEKARADGIAKEQLGDESLRGHLEPIWPADRPHLPLAEVADWFRSYVYLPKLRDPAVVLEGAVRNAVTTADPRLGYAASFDAAAGRYAGLLWGRALPEPTPPAALLVRKDAALDQLRREAPPTTPAEPGAGPGEPAIPPIPPIPERRRPTRFHGSVELDAQRPLKAFEGVVSAVVAELQRTPGARVRVTLDVQAEAADGFAEEDVGVVRDNARQLRFTAASTGFD